MCLQKNKNMNILKLIVAMACVSLGSCKKAAIVFPEENPMPQFLKVSGLDYSRTLLTLDNREIGFSFRPLVNGKITTLIAKLESINPNLRITLWDQATKQAIISNYLSVGGASIEVSKAISAIPLIKDKEYVLSIPANEFYRYTVAFTAPDPSYPITIGNIVITGAYSGNIPSVIPNVKSLATFFGDFSFIFQQCN